LHALRALRLGGNRAKRKRLRWQAANRGCHCFDLTFYWLLLATHATQAFAFGWKQTGLHGWRNLTNRTLINDKRIGRQAILFIAKLNS